MPNFAQNGAGLIEILVTLLIVSIGLMGLAALQIRAVRYNQDAYMRSIALTQVQSIADKIRANDVAADAGSYNNVTAQVTAVDCSASCTPAQMAQFDIFEWNAINARLLPNGLGTITGDGNNFTIMVRWETRDPSSVGAACGSTDTQNFSCLRVGLRR